jgi:hypothetical protein
MICTSCGPDPGKSDARISSEEIQQHVSYLAADRMKGREAGSPEEAMAANYISDWFEQYGLEPAGDEGAYTQEFKITKGRKEGPPFSYLLFQDSRYASSGDHARPWGQSRNGVVDGSLVFAGYGIEAPEQGYNDFENVDLTDRIALVLTHGPSGADNPHDDFGAFWPIERKVEAAVEHGAAGVIIANAPRYVTADSDTLSPLSYQAMQAKSRVPVIQITAKAASYIAESSGHDLEQLQQTINEQQAPQSMVWDEAVSISVSLQEDQRIVRNVLGLVRGTQRSEKYIIIGAHYDHLGMGGSGSLDSSSKPKIHNGADDNASGTAGVLELAQYYAQYPPKESVLFIGFSGEEMGLLGSNYFVKHPTVPLDQVKAMINMDMIGRLRNELIIFGTGTSNGWNAVLDSVDQAFEGTFTVDRVPDGTGASDHTPFYQAKLPVLHYFTDTHADYHRPSDDAEYIEEEGTKRILEHITEVVKRIEPLSDSDFHYTKAQETRRQDMKLSGPTLGVLPDYGFKGEGMRITGVSEGGPAEQAGLQGGDVIVKLGGTEVRDIYDYMGALNTLKQGTQTSVTVLRQEQEIQLDISL